MRILVSLAMLSAIVFTPNVVLAQASSTQRAYDRAVDCTGLTMIQLFYVRQAADRNGRWVAPDGGVYDTHEYDAVIERWRPVLQGTSGRLSKSRDQLMTDIRSAMQRYDFGELFSDPASSLANATRVHMRHDIIRDCASERLPGY
jgi:hypothetical protein